MLILLAMSYGEKIKEVRKRELMTQEVFAERIGVSRSVLSQIEIGRINPTAETLRNIARQFGVSLDYLVMDEAPLTEEQEYPDMDEETKDKAEEKPEVYNLLRPSYAFAKDLDERRLSKTAYYSRIQDMREIPFFNRNEWLQLEKYGESILHTSQYITLPVPQAENVIAVEIHTDSPVSWINCPLAIIKPMNTRELRTSDNILFMRRNTPVYGEIQYVDARGWVIDGTMYMNREIHTIWRLLDVIGLRMD